MLSRRTLFALTLTLLVVGALGFGLHRASALGARSAPPVGTHGLPAAARSAAVKAAPTAFAPPAANIVVTSTADGTLASLSGNGTCDLREAIAAANTNAAVGECAAGMAGADTITFAPGVAGTIVLAAGELSIGESLTITGPGANVLTVSGNNASRVFNITAGDVTLEGLTVANGRLSTSIARGGGINNSSSGTLTIRNCTIANNTAIGSSVSGGGIYHNGGTLNLISSTLSGNMATGNTGSAIATGGGMMISEQSTGPVNVSNSTIVNNSASASGGTSNLAGGGGLYNSRVLTLTNCTISNNSVTGTSLSSTGGGIRPNAGAVIMGNCIVANNTASQGKPDISGGIISAGYNLIKDTTGAFISGNTTGNQTGIDPLLGPLQYNSGPTQTMSPLPGSPVIDKGGAASEIQLITVSGSAGSFKLTFNGQTTGSITYTGNPSDVTTVQTALESLSNIGAGNVIVGLSLGSTSNIFTVLFQGALAGSNQPLLTASDNVSVTVTTQTSVEGASLTTDQRSVPRPQDNPSIANATNGNGSDIGAVEVFQLQEVAGMITLTADPATNPSGAVLELIEAINVANADPTLTTIKLVCGTYTLTSRNNTYYGFNGLPVITTPVTIQGNGAVIERSSSAPSFRLFAVANRDQTGTLLASPGSLTLEQVTLRGGLAQGGRGGNNASVGSAGGGGAGLGGAVFNQGTLTIRQSTLYQNTAQGGAGGSFVSNGFGLAGSGGGGLGGNGGDNTSFTFGGSGGGGFGGNGGAGASADKGGGEGGGRVANGNDGSGSTGGSGASAEGGDGGNEGVSGSPGVFGGGGGGGGFVGLGGAGGIGGGAGGGGFVGLGGAGGFGGGGGGGSYGFNGGSGGYFGGGGGGRTGGSSPFGGGTGGSNDSAGGGGGAGAGGAVFNDEGASVTITNSTFSANAAIGGAGGTGSDASRSGAAGNGLGGGLFSFDGNVTVNNTTFNLNTAQQGGGGIYFLDQGGKPTFTLNNTILANSTGISDCDVNSTGESATLEGDHNLIEINGASFNTCPGAIKSDDPQLGPLTTPECGGPGCKTPVHPITSTSPAYNMGGGDAESVDQCGTMRPQAGVADIGAFEVPYSAPPPVTLYTYVLADPLGCLGPDGLVTGTITLGNPAPFDQPFTLTTTFTNLTGIAGSCTLTGAAPGATCNVTASGLNAAGTLPANATLVVTYAARVRNVPVGTTVSASNTATLSGLDVPPVPLTASAVVNCPPANLKNPPTAAAVSDQKPGSVLVFPYYTSDASGNFSKSDTLLTITNVADGPSTGAGGAPNYSYLHLFFINGANCSPADTFVCLTPNGSLQIRASEYDPLTTGYLIAVAVNADGVPVQNNSFIGSAFIRDDVSGVMDSYGAEAFAKLSPGALAPDADGGATLYLDGSDYEAAPIQLAASLQDPAVARQTLVIASLRGDLGTKLDATSQSGVGGVWRDDEAPASFTNGLGSGCLIQRALTNQNLRLVPGTLTSFLQNRTGYLKVNLTSPAVGLLLTKQGAAGQPQGRFAGIRSLNKTVLAASALKLPVFAPVCQ